MNRQEKQAIVGELRNDFSRSSAAFLIEVKGLTVDQIQSLRKNVRKQGGSICVAKNTLLKIAAKNIPGIEDLQPYFKQQIAVVFAQNEPSSIAKALYDVAKENERLAITAGFFSGAVIDAEKVKYLATLPPREVLLAQILGALRAPLARQALLFQSLHKKLAPVSEQTAEQ